MRHTFLLREIGTKSSPEVLVVGQSLLLGAGSLPSKSGSVYSIDPRGQGLGPGNSVFWPSLWSRSSQLFSLEHLDPRSKEEERRDWERSCSPPTSLGPVELQGDCSSASAFGASLLSPKADLQTPGQPPSPWVGHGLSPCLSGMEQAG